tara:strand:+ start:2877 stop:3032 length:156 start_codon:yes stop_codon:yes gene_type:complete
MLVLLPGGIAPNGVFIFEINDMAEIGPSHVGGQTRAHTNKLLAGFLNRELR